MAIRLSNQWTRAMRKHIKSKNIQLVEVWERMWPTFGFAITLNLDQHANEYMHNFYKNILTIIVSTGEFVSKRRIYISIMNGIPKYDRFDNKYKIMRITNYHNLIEIYNYEQRDINDVTSFVSNFCKLLVQGAINIPKLEKKNIENRKESKKYFIVMFGIHVDGWNVTDNVFLQMYETIKDVSNVTMFVKPGYISNDFINISYQFEYSYDLNILNNILIEKIHNLYDMI